MGFNLAKMFAFPIYDASSHTVAIDLRNVSLTAYFRAPEDGRGPLGLELEAVHVHSLTFPVMNGNAEVHTWKELDDTRKRWMAWILRKVFDLLFVGWAGDIAKLLRRGEAKVNKLLGFPQSLKPIERSSLRQARNNVDKFSQDRVSIAHPRMTLLHNRVIVYWEGAELRRVTPPIAPSLLQRVLNWVLGKIKSLLYFIVQNLSNIVLHAPMDHKAYSTEDSQSQGADSARQRRYRRVKRATTTSSSPLDVDKVLKDVTSTLDNLKRSSDHDISDILKYLNNLEVELLESFHCAIINNKLCHHQ
jgi:hypothetical protein